MRINDLERGVLAEWRNGGRVTAGFGAADGTSPWIRLALGLALLSSQRVRSCRLGDLAGPIVLKEDTSPLTTIELEIERACLEELARVPEPVTFLGEESAGRRHEDGVTLAVDPVDGTWSLLNRTDTAATSLALLRRGRAFVSVISNPATAEIAYAVEGRPSRLLQLSAFGEPDRGVDLPIPPAGPEGLLVSLHPHRAAEPVAKALSRAWRDGELDMVRSVGGAPSLGLVEAAKGSFVYVNLWDRREAAEWDLAAGISLLRGAGGEAVDLSGAPLRLVGHRGPFVAAIREVDRVRVAALTRTALETRQE